MSDDQITLEDFDNKFFTLFNALSTSVKRTAGQSASHILGLSSNYLSKEASKALKDFHELYFADAVSDGDKEKVNSEVDDIMDEVLTAMNEGKTDQELSDAIQEDESLKNARLAISGVQKELETIISLEEGIREKLMPVLSSMQFEDSMRQRLEHIESGWSKVVSDLHNIGDVQVDQVGSEIADLTSSIDETTEFYKTVLKKDPPEDAMSDEGMITFF